MKVHAVDLMLSTVQLLVVMMFSAINVMTVESQPVDTGQIYANLHLNGTVTSNLLLSPMFNDADNGTADTSCFGELGCLKDDPAFRHHIRQPLNVSPLRREGINTTFRIHSREEVSEGVLVEGRDLSKVLQTSFSPNRKTKIILHGLLSDVNVPWMMDMISVLLTYYDLNVVAVDWSKGASSWRATSNLRVVGLEVAHFVNWLTYSVGLDPADVHIIGHSLGAHGAGYAGERIPGLGRITGLDPAGAYFNGLSPAVRLDPTDAQFVDVIHTDAGNQISFKYGLGATNPMGDIDFYPNNGKKQPGCKNTDVAPIRGISSAEDVIEKDMHGIGCSHTRAAKLFTDSIKSSCPYMAFMCNSYKLYLKGGCTTCGEDGSLCARMGLRAEDWKRPQGWEQTKQVEPRRKFYLSTVSVPSPCQYHSVLELDLDRPLKDLEWNLTISVLSNEGNATFSIVPSKISSGGGEDQEGHHTILVSHRHDLSESCGAFVHWNSTKDSVDPSPIQQLDFKNVDADAARGKPEGTTELEGSPNEHSSTMNKIAFSYDCNVTLPISDEFYVSFDSKRHLDVDLGEM